MNAKARVLVCALCVAACAAAAPAGSDNAIEIVRYENQFSRAHLEPGRLEDRPGIAVVFEGTQDLHYYARSETAPAPGFNLKIVASADGAAFAEPVYPPWKSFYDTAQQKTIEVHVGDFTVFVPLAGQPQHPVETTVKISGLACTSQLCLPPFTKTLAITLDPSTIDSWRQVSIAAAAPSGPKQAEAVRQAILPYATWAYCLLAIVAVPPINIMPCVLPVIPIVTIELDPNTIDSWRQVSIAAAQAPAIPSEPPQAKAVRQSVLPYDAWVYCLLAIVAGLSINIMPCVLPVIPLVMMRLIEQSKQSTPSRIAAGAAFCGGIVLFFLAFALISAAVNIWTGTALDLNSLFRYPAAVIVLFLALVLFGLAMLDVVTPALPSAIAGRQQSGSGAAGSLGMGFFAALLSTPCSGALLGFVLVWAQTQPRLVSSLAIVLMGVGMALPYAVIVAVPSLLRRLPKPGAWMDIFKKSTGFLLFFIAVKLTLAALPKDRLLNVLTYGVIFSFCVWMWGKWVGFSTPAARKWTVRLIALVIAVVAGLWLLPAHRALIDWQPYNAATVQQARDRGQAVLLDFTADWCANCKVVDRIVYQNQDVAASIKQKGVLAIRADTTLFDYPATADLKNIYGEAGNVPVTVVLLPNGEREKIRGIFDKARLIEVLTKLQEKPR